MKQLIAGIIISALLVYLSLRGIDYEGVLQGFKSIDIAYAAGAVVIMVLMQVIRSVRWGVILSPIHKVSQFDLFSVTNVGFLAIASSRPGWENSPDPISSPKKPPFG